jgi:subtilase family serine protease
MSTTIRCLGILFVLALLTVSFCPNASGQSWTSTATKAYPVQNLSNATLLGPLDPSTPLHIVVGLQEQNGNQVQPTLRRVLTPGDALYGTSFTVQQFVRQFGPTSAQVQGVQNYLSSKGFANIAVSDNQLLIEADGTAAGVTAAFNTPLAKYSVGGANVYVNTGDAQVPASLAGMVAAVLGLNNVVAVHIDAHTLALNTSPATDPCTPPNCPTPAVANEVFGPQQYQIAYDAACPSDNPHCPAQNFTPVSATAVGIIVEGDLTQVVKDLRTYEQTYNLPQVPVSIVNAGIPSPDTSGAEEWDLDSQVSTGIAQQVSHLYFYAATTLTDSDLALAINKAVSQNKVKAFNMSFGECEFSPYIDGAMLIDDQIFGEAALQGITPFAASDDNGSACPVEGLTNGVPLTGPPDTSYPASSPYVIAVGGTNLFTNADFTYDFETGWEASGGGPSYFENPPFWQTYTGSGTLPVVPSSEGSAVGVGRGVPDVSMCARGTGLAICSANVFVSGTATLIGGTSLSSPLAMGSWARIQTAHKNKLGFAGPLIYQLANGGPSPSSPDFNDVVLGGNGLFTALPGYDYVTGLGSWDIYRINALIPSTYPQ